MVWWEKPLRVVQVNIEDRYGRYLSSITGRDLIKLVKELGGNVLVLFGRDPWGRKFYGDSRYRHPKLRGDLIREAIEEGRKEGIKVVVMVAHTANRTVFREHSDWAQVNSRGEVILLEHSPPGSSGTPEWPQVCINSPYFDLLKEEVGEVAELGADGIFLDSFRYQPDFERACYCRWCRAKFREEKGYEMPVKPDWSDSRWRELWDWRYRVVVAKIRKLYRLVKRMHSDELFMYNSHPGGWAGRTNRVVELGREFMDAVFAECSEADHQPPGFITEMVKLTRAMLGSWRKPVFASRNYFHMYRTVTSTTEVAIKQGLREAVLGGGHPWVLIFSSALKQEPGALKAVKEVFRELRELEEYLSGVEPVKYAAILVSNVTRDHYGRDEPQHYVDEIRGFYYALTHSHIPVEFISDRDASEGSYLKGFKVLVAPNTVCFNEDLTHSVTEFVKLGGGLVATYLTSTSDGRCIERFNFSLRDVLGVELISLMKAPWSYVKLLERSHPVVSGLRKEIILWGDMSYDFRVGRVARNLGWHAVTKLIGGKALGTVSLATDEWGFEYTLGRSPPEVVGETNIPSVVVNGFGDGKSIYFSGQLGRHYWRLGLPEYLKLIVNSVTYVGGAPPLRVVAPSTLHAAYFIKGGKYLIHLLNHTYNQRIQAAGIGTTKQPLPPYSTSEAVHPPREVVRLSNVKVEVRLGRKVRAYSPLSGREFEVVPTGDSVTVAVGEVGEYELVVIE